MIDIAKVRVADFGWMVWMSVPVPEVVVERMVVGLSSRQELRNLIAGLQDLLQTLKSLKMSSTLELYLDLDPLLSSLSLCLVPVLGLDSTSETGLDLDLLSLTIVPILSLRRNKRAGLGGWSVPYSLREVGGIEEDTGTRWGDKSSWML